MVVMSESFGKEQDVRGQEVTPGGYEMDEEQE